MGRGGEAIRKIGALAAMLFGAAGFGVVGALWTGGSGVAWTASVLPLPVALVAGFALWFGVGLLSAGLRTLTGGRWPRLAQGADGPVVPGAWVFPACSVIVSLPAGVIAGAASGGPGPVAAGAVFAGSGLVFGSGVRWLVNRGLVPFLEPE